MFSSWSDAFGFMFAFVYFVYITLLPWFIQRKLAQKFIFIDGQNSMEISQKHKDFLAIEEQKYDELWGSFYEDLKTNSRQAMMYNFYFVLRRFFFTISLFYLYNYVALQIIVFTLSSEFFIIYFAGTKPFSIRK